MSAPRPLTELPSELRGLLDDDLEVTLTTRLRRTDEDDDAPDVTHYRADFGWRYYLGNEPVGPSTTTEEEDRQITDWAATHGAEQDEVGQLLVPLGTAQLVTIDRYAGRPFDQLDSISGDLADLGAALFIGVDDTEPFSDTVHDGGDLALLIDEIEVTPSLRGHGISVLALDILLSHFEASCAVAALTPADRFADNDGERARATAGLTRHWAKLGFEMYAGGVMTLDLTRPRPFHPGREGLRSV